jgi:hypothetical protein
MLGTRLQGSVREDTAHRFFTGLFLLIGLTFLLAAGVPNRAIAEQLVVTLETVKKHLSHLFDKLGVANRTQAVARARELGLLP